jgi:NADH:ubiquinone oxidoreductase subunit K
LTVLINQFLLLGAVLFCIGVYGVIARKNAVLVLLSIELINNDPDGHVFALYVLAIAAAEVGVGLGLVLLIFRNKKTIALDELSEMKG